MSNEATMACALYATSNSLSNQLRNTADSVAQNTLC
jgi:hypothetical protein